MIKLSDFVEDYYWIKKRLLFDVTVEEVEKTISDLLHQSLIKRNKDSKLVVSEGLLHTTNDVANEGIKKFYEQMLDNAKKN